MTALQTRTTRSLAVFVLLLGLAVAAGAPSSPIADAGEADADVLVLNDGGQFLFWSFRPAQAAEVFGTVKIAWLFDGVSVSWTSFVPALGVVNFALVAGAVLWVVSDGSQTINVRCATPGAADCLRAVYRGAPGDYAQVADIPADLLLTPGADGRYTVARGQQYTVVTAAPLPTGYTRFYLQWRPAGRPYATSAAQLIPPVGTTYTFTPTADAAGPTLITFDLTAARPHPVRPTHKPELGDVIVTTVVQVAAQTLRYDTLDTTGAVGTAGSYAFLEDPDDPSTAVTTYEGLRDGTTTGLLVHKADGYGASQAALYDAVETGDLVEWRQAADCFVRYQVTEVKADPTGTVPQKLLSVAWMTYAFAGCTGAIATTTAATLDWADLPDLGGTSLTTPVRHGPDQIIPEGWTGATETPVILPLTFPPEVRTYDIAVARQQLPHWRDPALPDHWEFIVASAHGDSGAGYQAHWTGSGRGTGLSIYRRPSWVIGGEVPAVERPNLTNGLGLAVRETRIIAGRPAWVSYGVPTSILDPWFDIFATVVHVYDPETDSIYTLVGTNLIYSGHNIDALITVAASLFADEGSSPIADAGEADADVLVLNDGGQFLFWSFGPAQAAEVFGTVKIAWLFDGVSVSWTSFVPALGVVNFALVAGAVLWVVSDGSQTINVGAPPGGEPPDAVLQQACSDGAAVGAGNAGLAGDCALLLAAKDPLRGTETLNWSADTAIADWEGITVGGTPPRVTRLWIDRNTSPRQIGRRITLTGTIPAALGGLAQLEWLTLSRHDLTGPIPPALGQLTNLTDLQLYGNELTGAIPPELGQLTNLTRLALQINQLTGPIPVELGNLTNLRALDLQNNSGLTGAIPASLGDLPNLDLLRLYNNSGLTGCIPPGLDDLSISDLEHLDLEACTITTTYGLTTAAGPGGRISPLPGTYSYLSGDRVTVTATPDPDHRISAWGGACSAVVAPATTCTLTMDANQTAGVSFVRLYTLTVTVTGDGGVTPSGTTTHPDGAVVPLTARWNDATHSFTGWGGACSGTIATCDVTMDADQSVTATFAALPADRCATPDAADCLRAVYRGAPDDYAQVADIPADLLLTPGADGRYTVERGQQITVVTAAPLPTGYTRFYLQWQPLGTPGTPAPTSFTQLIPPVGTTYTFTPTTDAAGPTLITFDLWSAKPNPLRPGLKPLVGEIIVTTVCPGRGRDPAL